MIRSFAWEYASARRPAGRERPTLRRHRAGGARVGPQLDPADPQPVDPSSWPSRQSGVPEAGDPHGVPADGPVGAAHLPVSIWSTPAWSFQLRPLHSGPARGIRIPPKREGAIRGAAAEPPAGPFARTHPDLADSPRPGARLTDLGKTGPDWRPTQLDRRGSRAGSAASEPDGPLTRSRPRENLQQAAEAAEAAQGDNMRATGEWLRYRINQPRPDRTGFQKIRR